MYIHRFASCGLVCQDCLHQSRFGGLHAQHNALSTAPGADRPECHRGIDKKPLPPVFTLYSKILTPETENDKIPKHTMQIQ